MHKSRPQNKWNVQKNCKCIKKFADFSERNIFISKDKSLNRKKTIWVRTVKTKAGV